MLNGHQGEPQRSAAIQRFKDAGRDKPRVLLMSSVGIVGLNLTCAHIVIFLVSAQLCIPSALSIMISLQDTLWSAQEDSQTIGRVWRKGQQRRVLVYRLIVLGTSDVFLNSLAFSKELMHLAFINAPTSVRECWTRFQRIISHISLIDRTHLPRHRSGARYLVRRRGHRRPSFG